MKKQRNYLPDGAFLVRTPKKTKPTHGGARKGAGRPSKEPTVVIRIPKSLVKKVKKLIEEHKKEDLKTP